MKYDSKTKKCTCDKDGLTFDDACEICRHDHELFCDALALEIVKELDKEEKNVKKNIKPL